MEAHSAVAWASTESGMVKFLSFCVSHHSMQHALKKLIKNIGMDDLKLSNFGIEKEEIEILAKNSMDTMGSLFKSSDPYKLSLEEVISIY